jgi:hypothetical protein
VRFPRLRQFMVALRCYQRTFTHDWHADGQAPDPAQVSGVDLEVIHPKRWSGPTALGY